MSYLFGGSGGGVFIDSVIAGEVYDPVYETDVPGRLPYQILDSFYQTTMGDQDVFATIWEGYIRASSASMLELWQADYAKSLRDAPIVSQRKWVFFDIVKELQLRDEHLPLSLSPRFQHDVEAGALLCDLANRIAVDDATLDLSAPIDEACSLVWSARVTVESAEAFGCILFGYQDTLLRTPLAVGLMGTSDGVRPIIHYGHGPVGGQGVSVKASETFDLDEGIDLRATYTASSGSVVLRYGWARTLKISGVGRTLDHPSGLQAGALVDDTQTFEGVVVAGDELLVDGNTFKVIAVAGSELQVTPIGLPLASQGVPYEIYGAVEVGTISLNLPAEAPNPSFSLQKFGVFSIAGGQLDLEVAPDPAATKRRRIVATVSALSYTDPTWEQPALEIPRLQEGVVNVGRTLFNLVDYTFGSNVLRLREPPERPLWAEYVGYDEHLIQDNFGVLVGLQGPSSKAYKAQVRGVFYAYYSGPTLSALRQGVHILSGLPISEEAGVVEAINPSYSGMFGSITIEGRTYLYPRLVGTSLALGDLVDAYAPLCDGVEVLDYITDPTWFVGRTDLHEIEKYHAFQVSLDLDVFDLSTFASVSEFVRKIKPTMKKSFFQAKKGLADDVTVTDVLELDASLILTDSFATVRRAVAYDDEIYGGGIDWAYDQGDGEWGPTSASIRGTAQPMPGVVFATEGSASLTGAGTTFFADLGGPGPVSERRVTLSWYRQGTVGRVAGSHDVEDASADFLEVGREVQPGAFVYIDGDFYRVNSVVSATVLRLDQPSPATDTQAYESTGPAAVWAEVNSVASDSALVFTAASPLPTGLYVLTKINNAYFQARYDQHDESCPEEAFEVSLTYVGAPTAPFLVDMPDSQTTVVSIAFTGTPGQTQTTTVTEPVV